MAQVALGLGALAAGGGVPARGKHQVGFGVARVAARRRGPWRPLREYSACQGHDADSVTTAKVGVYVRALPSGTVETVNTQRQLCASAGWRECGFQRSDRPSLWLQGSPLLGGGFGPVTAQSDFLHGHGDPEA